MCFTGISENLAETPILKDIFIFLANGHSFQKLQFLVDIVSFLREVFSVFEKCQFLVALFPFGKKCHFYAKSVSFWPNKWIFKYSDKIISCKHQFLCKTVNFGGKNRISWEMLIFSNNCALLLKVNILLENMLIFRKLWLFVWWSIYIKKLSNSDKNFNFS